MSASPRLDEFGWIKHLLRPLTRGAPEALDLLDDAAVLPSRPGFDLVLTKDAMVEGVHYLAGDPLDGVARKLLAVNLSDLAAKGAEPFGYLLMTAWPTDSGWAPREAFVAGLARAGADWNVSLLGGDTVSTPGSATFSLTLLGWVPAGRMIRRSGARPGDLLCVSGTIGDGWLGLAAARAGEAGYLAGRYRNPTPRLDLRESLLGAACAAADVSDGLLADAGHLAKASGCAARIELSSVPLSDEAAAWLARQHDRAEALVQLVTGGDDYEIVCAMAAPVAGLTPIGTFESGEGVFATLDGAPVALERLGWTHG